MSDPFTFRKFDPLDGPHVLGTLWTMTRGGRALVCALHTHPLGWELRATVGDELARSHVCKRSTEILDVADAWRREAITKGWTAAADA